MKSLQSINNSMAQTLKTIPQISFFLSVTAESHTASFGLIIQQQPWQQVSSVLLVTEKQSEAQRKHNLNSISCGYVVCNLHDGN